MNAKGALSLRYGVLSGPLAHAGGDAYFADFDMWGAPPVLFEFRRDPKLGEVLDWDGRIFVQR